MSVFSNETFLPGVITEIESDYSFGYDTSKFGTTDSVLIIGTAFNGPVGKPVPVYSPEHARYLFGKAYDVKNKKEATLVAGVQDAYDRGCRTIYAVRVSGKDIFKDYEMSVDMNLRLRVAGVYPSNEAKDVYFLFDNTPGDEKFVFYKPAARATISEKMQGLVENDNAVLVTEIKLGRDYGIGRDSLLVDAIRTFNEHPYNNVLRLSVVDLEGVDVTNRVDVFDSRLGLLFPGVYFIGRDRSLCASFSDVKFNIVSDSTSAKPYESFDGVFFRSLKINTDAALPYPVYASNYSTLRSVLKDVEIVSSKEWDFLETQGLSDRAFAKDSTDYEEAGISSFEIYKRLGSGYALTARAERRVDGAGNEITPRVKEAPADDVNRISSIVDGIYSVLENAKIRYRVLTCGAADQEISAKIPRPADFLTAVPNSITVLKDYVEVVPKVKEADQFAPKKYTLKFANLSAVGTDDLGDIYADKIMKIVAPISSVSELTGKTFGDGSLFLVPTATAGDYQLKRMSKNVLETMDGAGFVDELIISGGKIYKGVLVNGAVVFRAESVTANVPADGFAQYSGKEYVLADNNGDVYCLRVIDDANAHVKPLGDIKTMMTTNSDKTLVYAQSNWMETNPILVQSGNYTGFTLSEFVEFLNNHECLSRLFSFELTGDGANVADQYMNELGFDFGLTYDLNADRSIGYNYSKYIPYRTLDNFARQLAQHCTYTELKTCPAHGVIGAERIMDTGLAAVANKVDGLLDYEADLYAKNKVGRNMLDKNNLPYPIGKNLSIVFEQHLVIMDDGYRFLSNGAAGYAGMVARLPLDTSSTNQPIAINNPLLNLTNYQLGRLTQKGIVTIRDSFNRGYVVTDGVTMAPSTSVFRRLAASRVMYAVEELIRAACDPYVGKQNSPANRNSIKTAIKSSLDKVQGVLIEKYTFNLIVDPSVAKFNILNIDYQIVPIYEIREIRNRISVKDQI